MNVMPKIYPQSKLANIALFYDFSFTLIIFFKMMELMCLSGTSLALLVTFKPDLNIKPTLIALWAFYISLFKVKSGLNH